MMILRLTRKQRNVLTFIKETIAESGVPPTRREISDEFRWSSANSAENHIKALRKKGYIDTLPDKKSRGIILRSGGA